MMRVLKSPKLIPEPFIDLHNGSLSAWGGLVGLKVTDLIKLSNGEQLLRMTHQPLLDNNGQGRTLGDSLVYPLLPGTVIEII